MMKSLGLILLCSIVGATSAAAHPQCDDGGFALVHGHWISSQWCQEELATQVSRRRGWTSTASGLHSSPAKMEEFCRGNNDIRFNTACAPFKD